MCPHNSCCPRMVQSAWFFVMLFVGLIPACALWSREVSRQEYLKKREKQKLDELRCVAQGVVLANG